MIITQYSLTGFRLSNQYIEIMHLPPYHQQAGISQWECEIKNELYKLYKLTEKEIIIENKK